MTVGATPMRLALCQQAGTPGDVAANLAAVAALAAEAAGRGAGLAVFPELFLTGYNLGRRLRDLAEPADGPSAQALAGLARAHGIALALGYAERAGNAVYNSAMLIDAAGRPLLNHRKLHLWGEGERAVFEAGDRLSVARLGALTVGLLICYDIEFPEAARRLALSGADLLLVPTALPARFDRLPQLVIPARAWENQLFVAYANRCGEEAGLAYLGGSLVAGPDGAVLARAGRDPALLIADLDPDALAASRAENPYLADRRPEAYGL